MASQQRCEDRSSAKPVIRRGNAPSEATGAGNHHTNRVVRATLRPGSGRAGPRQAEEGRVPPTADGRKREDTVASQTASCYPLRESQTRSRRRGTATGPGVRPATSPTKGSATRTGSRRDVTREGRERLGDEDNGSAHARTSTNVEQQPARKYSRYVQENQRSVLYAQLATPILTLCGHISDGRTVTSERCPEVQAAAQDSSSVTQTTQ